MLLLPQWQAYTYCVGQSMLEVKLLSTGIFEGVEGFSGDVLRP